MNSTSPPGRALRGALSALSLVLASCSTPPDEAPAPAQAPQPAEALAPAQHPVIEERAFTPLPALPEAPRGLGSMTARLPGTSEVVGGMRLAVHRATVTISQGIAHTEIEEEFRNDTGRVLEGRLVFPMPSDAALGRLALWVGKDLVEGEVVEKSRADRIFRGIVDDTVRPRDPALLDVVSGGRVSLRIFPVPAHGSRKVVLAYDQILRRQGGVLRYTHPLSLGADRATPIDALSVTVNGVTRVDKTNVIPDEDVVVTVDEEPPAVLLGSAPVHARKGERPQGREGAAVIRAVAEAGPGAAPFAGDVVVALDTSEGQSAASLAAQIHLADAVIARLSEGESFALLACDSACASFPEKGLAAASPDAREEARRFLSRLAPAGPSDVAGALVSAAGRLPAGRPGQVLLLSDGTATSGELSVASQLAHAAPRLSSLDVRVVGVGRAVDDRSLGALARGLGATYDRLATGAPLADRVDALARARRAPVVSAPRVALPEGLDSAEPAEPTPTRAGDEVIVLARASAAPPAAEAAPEAAPGSLDAVDATGAVRAAAVRLWARERVAELETRGDEANAEITALSLRHRLLSRATSLLVLENDQMFAEFGIPRSAPGIEAPELAPVGASGQAGLLGGSRRASAPRVRMGATMVSGRLPPEAVQRVVRQNFGRFRGCYEQGLRRNPGLEGRVTARFVITRDGSVGSAGDGGSDLPDAQVIRCIVSSFAGLSFPQPEGGVVTVVYPIVFSPEGGSSAEKPRPAAVRLHSPNIGAVEVGDRWPSNSELKPKPWEPPPPVPPSVAHRAGHDRWLDGPAQADGLAERVARDPERRRGHLELARRYLSAGHMEDAYKAAAALVALDPDLPAAREALAEAAAASGRGAEAARAVEAASALDPRSAPRQLAAARAALATGDEQRACAHLRALGDLLPREHQQRAEACREGKAPSLPELPRGGFEASSPAREGAPPSLVVLTPAGRVLSAWTGQGEGSSVFGPLMAGTYRTLLVSPSREGEVTVRALGSSFTTRVTDGRKTATVSEVTIPIQRRWPVVRW